MSLYLLEQVLKFDYMYAMYFKPKFEFFFGYLYLRKDLKSGDAQKCLYVLLVYTSKSGPMLVVLLSMSMSCHCPMAFAVDLYFVYMLLSA